MNAALEPFAAGSVLASRSPRLLLVVTAGREREGLAGLIAALALRGPACVLAGSDWVPGYGLAHALRRRTVEVAGALERVRLARAFTCYQLLDLLAGTAPDSCPLLVLDFLHTFYSPDIPLPVRWRVLNGCGRHLQRLAVERPVAVIVQHTAEADSPRFFSFLAAIADEVLQALTAPAESLQPSLFPTR
jgi:hypothetical protein